MKKFLIAFLLVFLVQVPQYSLAKTETVTVYSGHSTSGKYTVRTEDSGFYTRHRNQTCSTHSISHCIECHTDHYAAGGAFTKEPACGCSSNIRNGSGTAPSGSGWTKKEETKDREYTCGNNMPGQRVQAVKCTWKEITYTRTTQDTCKNHPSTCVNDNQPESAHGTGSLKNKEIYTYKSYTCDKCGTKYTRPACREKGGSGGGTSTPSPSPVGCGHTVKCSFDKTEGQHPHTANGKQYYWNGLSTNPNFKCKKCGEIVRGTCSPGETPPDPSPDPPECPPHDIDSSTSHDHYTGGDIGSKATTNSRLFYSKIDTTEEYRRNNPFNIGSKFSLFGEGHVAGSVVHNPVTRSWECTGGTSYWCTRAECDYTYFEACYESGSYLDWNASTPTYTDVYHNVSMSFEGFSVNGKNFFTFSNPQTIITTQRNRPQMLPTDYSENYVITALDSTNLKEDSATGLLYGWAYVRCQCGCTVDKYKIYFDLTPLPPPVSEMYTLTLKAEGAPKTGGVQIVGINDDYKDYTQKQSSVNDPFSIRAKANLGYEFDAWYKVDGKKYSADDGNKNGQPLRLRMPGYNFTLIAKFLPSTRYNVVVLSDGNGDVKFDGKYDDGQEGWEIATNVIKGDSVSMVAKPYDNFTVDYWELIRKNENLGGEEKLTINNVQEDYIIFVHFKPIDPNKENYKPLITKSWGPGIAIGGTDYAIPGRNYPIWAIPDKDAMFYFWEGQIGTADRFKSDYGAEDIIKMPDDRYILTAYFQPDDNNIYYQVIVEGDGNGDISIDGGDKKPKDSTTVVDGTVITIEAYPDDDFKFDRWTDEDGNVVPGGDKNKVTIDEDKIYIAHFEYIGNGETYELNVESAGGGKAYRDVDDAIPGEEYHIKAVPNENCEFLYWADKETGEITNYAKDDYVIMPERDLTLVAHFREVGEVEEKYYLTLKTTEGGTATGEGYYKPDEVVNITATEKKGYQFVGWYEDNQLVSTMPSGTGIRMPYYDMTLTAVFKKADDTSENSPFKILSIRDVRWKDYFTSNGTTTNNELYVPMGADSNTVLVNAAKLVDNSFDQHRDIVYGYAVEFELVTTGLPRSSSNLVVIPKLYERTSSGRINPLNVDMGAYASVKSSSDSDIEKFVITWNEKLIKMENNQTAPQVTWRWVWYLPLDIHEEICNKVGNGSDVIVQFDIGVTTKDGKKFDYVKAINSLNKSEDKSGNYVRSDWGGKVFTYRLDKTLLTDIYDNATN